MATMGRPPKYTTVEELEIIIQAYFAECDPHVETGVFFEWDKGHRKQRKVEREYMTEQQPYTMAGLARRLHLSRQALMEYKNGDQGEDIGDAIKAARAVVEEFNERLLLSGKYATGAIFNLKVNFGFKEHEEENKPPENPIIFINNVPAPADDPKQ